MVCSRGMLEFHLVRSASASRSRDTEPRRFGSGADSRMILAPGLGTVVRAVTARPVAAGPCAGLGATASTGLFVIVFLQVMLPCVSTVLHQSIVICREMTLPGLATL